ncbi:MAG: hypothetical protein K1X75_08525 [Leptospirales bacterium]|nr:hypothetical protein [Leptospirales bacterium]
MPARARSRRRLPGPGLARLLFCLLTICLPASALMAAPRLWDWDDLEPRTYRGSEKEEKIAVDMLIVQAESWPEHWSLSVFWGQTRYTRYPEFRSFYFWPFYGARHSLIDDRQSHFVFPFYYYRSAAEQSFLMTPLGFRWRDQTETWSYVLPLFYHVRRAEDSYWALWPILFRSSRHDGASGSFTLFPLLHRSARDADGYGATITPLFYHEGSDTPERNFLLTPLFVSDWRPGEFSLLSWLFYYDRLDASDESTLASPVFYRYAQGEQRRTNWYGLVYWRDDPAAHQSSQALLPLIYHSISEHRSQWIFLPLLGWRTRENADLQLHDFAMLSLLGYYRSRQRGDVQLQRSIVAPLFYYDRSETELSWLAPLLYWHRREREDDKLLSYFMLLHYGAHESHRQKHGWNSEAVVQANPLFYYSDSIIQNGTQLQYHTHWHAPLLPLVYRSADSEEGTSTAALLAHWKTNRDGDLERLWLLPLFYYSPGSYLYFFPFYFQPDSSDDAQLSFSPLHYYSRDGSRSSVWIINYYDLQRPAEGESYVGFIPFYFDWQTPESSGNLLIPLRLRYEDRSKLVNLYAVGLAFSQQLSLQEAAAAPPGMQEFSYDQDISLLYNLFRLSWRTSFLRPAAPSNASQSAANAADGQAAVPSDGSAIEGVQFEAPDFETVQTLPEDAPPRRSAFRRQGDEGGELSDDPGFSREESRNFFGLTALFGLIAYERADDERSFRAAPLWWFRWSEANEDQVSFVFGAYFSYREKDLEYFALTPLFLPIYGRQRSGDSYAEAYLVALYWNEYDADEQRSEGTILWPLINWHHSPQASGSRFLPFYYYREDREQDSASSLFLSPLYFRQSARDGGWSLLLPLFFYSYQYRSLDDATASRDQGEDAWLLVPGLYCSWDGGRFHWNGLIIADYESDPDGSRFALLPLFSWRRGKDAYLWLGPFYFEGGDDKGQHSLFPLYSWNSRRESELYESSLLTPLFYTSGRETPTQSSRQTISWLYYSNRETTLDASGQQSEDWTLLVPGFYLDSRPKSVSWNALLLADYESSVDGDPSDYRRFLLFPLFGGRSGEDGWAYVIPVYYGWNDVSRETSLHLMPLFWTWREQDRFTAFLAGLYLRNEPGYSRQNFLYLFDREARANSLEWSLAFHFVSYEGDDRSSDFRLGYGLLAGYQSDMDRTQMNLLWWREIFSQQRRMSSFAPFWHYDRDGDSLDWFLLPALSGGSYSRDEGWTALGLGALYYRGYDDRIAQSTTHLLLGAAYLQIQDPENGYRSRGSLWGILWNYEEESATDFRKFSILKFLYSRTQYQGRTSQRILGIKISED